MKHTQAVQLLQQRLEETERRIAMAEEQSQMMLTREDNKFNEVSERAMQLEQQLAELGEVALRQRAELRGEANERQRLESEQRTWMSDVRQALLKSDASASDKLAEMLATIHDKMVVNRCLHRVFLPSLHFSKHSLNYSLVR